MIGQSSDAFALVQLYNPQKTKWKQQEEKEEDGERKKGKKKYAVMKIDEMAESKNEAIVKQKRSSWPKTTYNFHHRSARVYMDALRKPNKNICKRAQNNQNSQKFMTYMW